MKLAKSLLLGAAAGFAAVAGAQAADLPSRKSAPVAYVKICDAYGAGFFYIPGTDTCLKVGGYVRAEWQYTPGKDTYSVLQGGDGGYNGLATFAIKGSSGTIAKSVQTGPLGILNFTGGFGGTTSATASQVAGAQDTSGTEVRGRIDLDARTPTSFGTVRTAVRLRAANTSGIRNTNPANNSTWTMATASTTGITIEAAYVQWAGFTFGVAPENYAMMPSMMYNSNSWAGFPNGMKQLAYTATFGGGFSATLALEDRQDFGSATAATTTSGTATGWGSSYGTNPSNAYHLVGNIRVDQSWGFAALHGMIGNNSVSSGFALNPAQCTSTTTSAALDPQAVFVGNGVNNTAFSCGAFLNPMLGGNAGFAPQVPSAAGLGLSSSTTAGAVLPLTTLGGTNAAYSPLFGSKNFGGWAIGSTVKFNLPMLAAGDAVWFTANYSHGLLGALLSAGSMQSLATASGRRVAGGITNIPSPLVVTGGNGTVASPYTMGTTTGWNVAMAATHYWAPQWRSNFAAGYVQINPPTVSPTTTNPFQWGRSSTWFVSGGLIYSPAKDFDIGLEVQYLSTKSTIQNIGIASNNVPGAPGTCSVVAGCPGLKSNNISTHLRIERAF